MTPRRALGAFVAVVGLAGFAWLVAVQRERADTRHGQERLREELHALRSAADSCQYALALEEAGFLTYDRQVDSLREEVRQYEALDERGVPRDRYEAYMETFERYNLAVPDWEARAETLQAHWEACRALAHDHNALADSLRRWVEEGEARADEEPG